MSEKQLEFETLSNISDGSDMHVVLVALTFRRCWCTAETHTDSTPTVTTNAHPVCLGPGTRRCSKSILQERKSESVRRAASSKLNNKKPANQESRSFQTIAVHQTTRRHARATPTQKQAHIFEGAPIMGSLGAMTV